ncbi:hypothetical protein J6590_026633 [Homalodisca vitripennis]|nr:hypothetical protein J6590_026633 [Homalodisca vitripennis]
MLYNHEHWIISHLFPLEDVLYSIEYKTRTSNTVTDRLVYSRIRNHLQHSAVHLEQLQIIRTSQQQWFYTLQRAQRSRAQKTHGQSRARQYMSHLDRSKMTNSTFEFHVGKTTILTGAPPSQLFLHHSHQLLPLNYTFLLFII